MPSMIGQEYVYTWEFTDPNGEPAKFYCNMCGMETSSLQMHPTHPLLVCMTCYDTIRSAVMQMGKASLSKAVPAEAAEKQATAEGFTWQGEIVAKSSDEKRITYGVVYPAKPAGWTDTQGDWISEPEIEKMAHEFMVQSQRFDIQHKQFDLSKQDAVVVESFIAPVDFSWPLPDGKSKDITKGSWIVATHYPSDEKWEMVKSGKINAYSIRGRATRRKIG